MPRYISAGRLKTAIDRLRRSRARKGMINFLILKRAIVLDPENTAKLSMTDKHLQQAVTELTWWPADPSSDEDRPFINVFGQIKDKKYGTISRKYRTNGPADTWRNNVWRSILEISGPDRGKFAKLREDYLSQLEEMTLLKDKSRPKPGLRDAAVWYFRGKDIEPLLPKEALESSDAIEEKLALLFCEDLGLTDDDVEIVFETEAPDDGE